MNVMLASRRRRIVHVTSAHPPGDIRIAHKECRSLAEAGYDVTLVHREAPFNDSLGFGNCPIPADRGRISRMLVTARRACIAARSLSADLYHLHDPELLLWARLLRRTGKPVVFDMHEDLSATLVARSYVPAIVRRPMSSLAGALQRRLLTGRPVVFAESSYVAGREWVGPHAVVLNLPLIDKLISVHEDQADCPTVGYLGAVDPSRGSLVTLEALALLAKNHLPVRWVCAGPATHAHEEELRRLAADLGVNLELHSAVPPLVGWRLMARCHVGLAVLAPVPNYIISYPTKMFEYMGLGVPAVVSNFDLYRAVVEVHNCGIAVDPTDPHAIAEAIRRLIENPEIARAMGENGRRAVIERYNWATEKDKLLQLYDELLK